MATCKDCFHFDVCRAMLEATCGIRIDDDFKGGAGSCKKFVSSADVAPRAEVAREIFWEIDKLLLSIITDDEEGTRFVGVDMQKYYALKNKHTEDKK